MKSGYKIKWTNHALYELKKTFEYLEENWTERELGKLSNEIERVILLLSKNPDLFQSSNKKLNVRKAVITKHNTMYYRKNENIIEILSFFSSQQDPNRLKL
jgi:plasmid stabilization system protein ParE